MLLLLLLCAGNLCLAAASGYPNSTNDLRTNTFTRFLTDLLKKPLGYCEPVILLPEDTFHGLDVYHLMSEINRPGYVLEATYKLAIVKYPFFKHVYNGCFVFVNVGSNVIRYWIQELHRRKNIIHDMFVVIESPPFDYFTDIEEYVPNALFIPWNPDKKESTLTISVYGRPVPCRSMTPKQVGLWRNGFEYMMPVVYPSLVKDYQGCVLTVTVLPSSPSIIKKTYDDGSVVYSGVEVNLLKGLAKLFNFRYKIKEPRVYAWGKIVNGSWEGLIGEVANVRSDISMASISVTESRYQVADFTTPFLSDGLTFATASPKPLAQWNVVFNVYQRNTWLAVFAAAIVSSILVVIISRLTCRNKNILQESNISKEAVWSNKFGETVYYSITFMSLVFSRYPPNLGTVQIALGFWMLTCMILACAYTSQLMSLLAVTQYESMPESIEDLVKEDYVIEKYYFGNTWDRGITSGSSESLAKLKDRVVYHDYKGNTQEVKRAALPKHSFFKGSLTLRRDTFLFSEKNLRMAKSVYMETPIAMALPNGSPLRHSLDWGVLIGIQGSFISHWYDDELWKYVKRKGNKTTFDLLHIDEKKRSANTVDKGTQISMYLLQSPFYFLLFGLLGAIICFVVEKVFHLLYKKSL